MSETNSTEAIVRISRNKLELVLSCVFFRFSASKQPVCNPSVITTPTTDLPTHRHSELVCLRNTSFDVSTGSVCLASGRHLNSFRKTIGQTAENRFLVRIQVGNSFFLAVAFHSRMKSWLARRLLIDFPIKHVNVSVTRPPVRQHSTWQRAEVNSTGLPVTVATRLNLSCDRTVDYSTRPFHLSSSKKKQLTCRPLVRIIQINFFLPNQKSVRPNLLISSWPTLARASTRS